MIFTFGASTIQENAIQDNGIFGIGDGRVRAAAAVSAAAGFPAATTSRGNAIDNNGGSPGVPGSR